jgi:hypothetical protein
MNKKKFKVIDAFGKIPSGILQGALKWPGEYSQCLNISVESINWNSKYCSINTQNNKPIFDPNNIEFSFFYGTCFPRNCSENDIASIINLCILAINF